MLYSRAEFLSWNVNYYMFVFTKCKSANMTTFPIFIHAWANIRRSSSCIIATTTYMVLMNKL